jgi:hypothetical protein
VVCKLISPVYELAPGERVVEDNVIEGEYQQYSLMIAVHQRITTDPTDQGMLGRCGGAVSVADVNCDTR